MKLRQSSCLILAIAFVMLIAGCGGSGSSPNPPTPPAITVAFSPQAPASMDAGAATGLTAVVSNDSAKAGVKWSVSCGSPPCGSFTAASTASGTATQYTAPASVPNPATVTVTATSVTDSTKSASATITISAPSVPISVTLNAPPSSLAAGANVALTATVANDNANAGVAWSVTCGSAQCGSFTPSTTPSGTATSYTAPVAPPTPASVTVTATSVTDNTKSASASITITAALPVLADGNYVFHVAGQDGNGTSNSNGNYYLAGAFTVQNGVITNGEQDMSDATQYASDPISPSGSSLGLVNGNIQIVLNTNDSSVGVNGVETFNGTVVSGSRVLISEFDTFATATGSIDLQTSTAAPAGGYAFNLGGLDGTAQQDTFVLGGILNISGASVNAGNSIFDYNDGGSVAQGQAFTSGSISAPDAFGRIVITLTPTAASGIPFPFALAGYTVGTNQIQLVETPMANPGDDLGADLGGVALGQESSAGQFNQASIANSTYVFGAIGEDAFSQNSTIAQMAGDFVFNANGTVSGSVALNDLTYQVSAPITSGTYTVDPTGRVTLTVAVAAPPPLQNPSFAFQLYLDGNGNALELGVDANEATSGLAYQQTASSSDFEGSYALNAYGVVDINAAPAWSAVGPVTVASDAFSGFTDYSVQNSSNSASIVTPGVSLTGTETNSTGQFSLNWLSPQIQSSFGYWPIDNRRVIAIELDGQQSGVLMLEGLQPN